MGLTSFLEYVRSIPLPLIQLAWQANTHSMLLMAFIQWGHGSPSALWHIRLTNSHKICKLSMMLRGYCWPVCVCVWLSNIKVKPVYVTDVQILWTYSDLHSFLSLALSDVCVTPTPPVDTADPSSRPPGSLQRRCTSADKDRRRRTVFMNLTRVL